MGCCCRPPFTPLLIPTQRVISYVYFCRHALFADAEFLHRGLRAVLHMDVSCSKLPWAVAALPQAQLTAAGLLPSGHLHPMMLIDSSTSLQASMESIANLYNHLWSRIQTSDLARQEHAARRAAAVAGLLTALVSCHAHACKGCSD